MRSENLLAVNAGADDLAEVRGAWLSIDLDVLAANIRLLRAHLAQDVALMAVVKADAYGLGAERVATVAIRNGATALGVTTIPEALRLRRAAITAPIQLLGLVPPQAYASAIAAELQLTISSLEQARALAGVAQALGRRAQVQLKVDTGMGRIGCSPEEAVAICAHIRQAPALELVGLWSHFATTEADDLPRLAAQVERFRAVDAQLQLPPTVVRHLANSAGALYYPPSHFGQVRVGYAMYGLVPDGPGRPPLPLRPVFSLRARVTQVRAVPAGTGIGYGGHWRAEKATRLALIPLGYADGLPYAEAKEAVLWATVQRTPCPIIGGTSMNMSVIDVGDVPVAVGDAVELMHPVNETPHGIERWARIANTDPTDLLCRMGQQLPRRYSEGISSEGVSHA